MYTRYQDFLSSELNDIQAAGTFKDERIIISPQGAEITISSGQKVLNFCMNNYLGLSNSPELIAAAKEALDTHGYGMSSVRFICGTQDLHKTLERKLLIFLEQRTPFYTQQPLMQMEVFLNHFLAKMMQ